MYIYVRDTGFLICFVLCFAGSALVFASIVVRLAVKCALSMHVSNKRKKKKKKKKENRRVSKVQTIAESDRPGAYDRTTTRRQTRNYQDERWQWNIIRLQRYTYGCTVAFKLAGSARYLAVTRFFFFFFLFSSSNANRSSSSANQASHSPSSFTAAFFSLNAQKKRECPEHNENLDRKFVNLFFSCLQFASKLIGRASPCRQPVPPGDFFIDNFN